MDGIHLPIREVLKGVGRRVIPLHEGVHLEAILESSSCCIRLTFLIQETPQNQPIDLAGGRRKEITIGVGRCFLAWPQN